MAELNPLGSLEVNNEVNKGFSCEWARSGQCLSLKVSDLARVIIRCVHITATDGWLTWLVDLTIVIGGSPMMLVDGLVDATRERGPDEGDESPSDWVEIILG